MKEPNMSTTSGVITVISVVLSALSLLTLQTQVMAQTSAASFAVTAVGTLSSPSSSSPSTLNSIFKQVQNSVVQIISKVPIPSTEPSNPQPQQNSTALGSGFIYDKAGRIVTNNHVVGDAKIVDVTFVDGNRYTAKVIGTDIYSDIAVIQIQNTTKQQPLPALKPLVIGNSSKLEVGDPVIAIGNPFGLSDTLTTGIVSGVGRLLPSAGGAGFSIPNAIQTDAPINPGNSGGPLLNMRGEVVGINTAVFSGTGTFSGIGFAVPSNAITKIVPTLIEKGTYPHPYFGAKITTLTSDILQNITTGLPLSSSSSSAARTALSNLKGAYVDTITKNGPADKAGVHGSTTDQYSLKHGGDIITAIDGRPIAKSDDLITYIDQHKSVGDNITLTVYRNGHTLDLKATLTARPSPIPFLTIKSAPSPLPPNSPPSVPPAPPSTRPPMIPRPHS
ncbi:MAG: trypsin-like peptidase domain-containing protein [Nitrososphaeraceae archaeon]|nr:trypsin-like peptidase domain-containing protein [Nitrososphaeraceae archaeon]